uniref:Mitotic-spindle organizing protein 1 n=2 Tax=Timema TaxID=61471 RepID=A0A7R9NW19_9NEOP|nr:unnamed protein product [Timema tahoe]
MPEGIESGSNKLDEAKQTLNILQEISDLLNTGLTPETLNICVRLCEYGVNPEALALVLKEINRELAVIKPSDRTDRRLRFRYEENRDRGNLGFPSDIVWDRSAGTTSTLGYRRLVPPFVRAPAAEILRQPVPIKNIPRSNSFFQESSSSWVGYSYPSQLNPSSLN